MKWKCRWVEKFTLVFTFCTIKNILRKNTSAIFWEHKLPRTWQNMKNRCIFYNEHNLIYRIGPSSYLLYSSSSAWWHYFILKILKFHRPWIPMCKTTNEKITIEQFYHPLYYIKNWFPYRPIISRLVHSRISVQVDTLSEHEYIAVFVRNPGFTSRPGRNV